MKVTIVEDDLISRKWLQRFLTKWGYEVECYADGADAWNALEKGSGELILVDWMMPNLNGVELCRRLRANPNTQESYVILLTARSAKPDMIEGLESGADDYLVKPVDPDELKTRIRVGKRAIELRSELRVRVGELESLRCRHNVLGEVCARNLQTNTPAPGHPDNQDALRTNAETPLRDLEDAFGACFEQIGWGPSERVPAIGVSANTLRVSAALIEPGSNQWIDFDLDLSRESARTVFERMTGRIPFEASELDEGLIAAVGVIQNGLGKTMASEGVKLFTPFMPVAGSARGADRLQPADRTVFFGLRGATVRLELRLREVESRQKRVVDLEADDVLAETARVDLGGSEITLREGRLPTLEALNRISGLEVGGQEVRVLQRRTRERLQSERRLFDLDALLERTEGDVDFLMSMVRSFLNDNFELFQHVRDAIDVRNWEAAISTAHTLKGSVGYFSSGVADTVAQVEDAARRADPERAKETSAEVGARLAQLVGELHEFVEEPSSAAV